MLVFNNIHLHPFNLFFFTKYYNCSLSNIGRIPYIPINSARIRRMMYGRFMNVPEARIMLSLTVAVPDIFLFSSYAFLYISQKEERCFIRTGSHCYITDNYSPISQNANESFHMNLKCGYVLLAQWARYMRAHCVSRALRSSHILKSYDTFRFYFINNLVTLGVITRDHIVLITNDDWKYANIVQWHKHCPYNNSARVIPRLNYVIYRAGNDQWIMVVLY